MLSFVALTETGMGWGLGHGATMLLGGIFAGLAFFWLLAIIAALAFLVFWILMLVDAVQRPENDYKKIANGDKNTWIAILVASVFLGMHWLSAILYYLLVKTKIKK